MNSLNTSKRVSGDFMSGKTRSHRYNLYYIFLEDKQNHPPDAKKTEEIKSEVEKTVKCQ